MNEKKTKKRKFSLRLEKHCMKYMDLVSAALVFAVSYFMLAKTGLSLMYICVLLLVHAGGAIFFLNVLEEYTPTLTTIEERVVSIILANFFALAAGLLINLIFIRAGSAALVELGSSVLLALIQVITNYSLYRNMSDESRYSRQKLLIIADKNGEYPRMKRVKYGTLQHFDSWYESFDLSNQQKIVDYLEENVDNYDAVCIFDDVYGELYQRIVTTVIHLDKELYIVPKMADIGCDHKYYIRFDDVLVYYVSKYELSAAKAIIKRALDLAISIIGLIIAAIPMIIIAIAIKLTSPGPIFYRQERYTKDKKIFMICKFRSMVQDAEKKSGPVLASKDDPRITKVGAILRKYRLDELPQLFNILRGDMSVVGPRPERPFFVEKFEKEITNYNYRFKVPAGLTSLSHVYGRYSTYIHDRTCYDLLYIANYSIWLDLKIILLTAKTMFISNAAEGEDEFKTK